MKKYMISDAIELVELIARMKTEQEQAESGLCFEPDVISALDELIVSARQITGIKGPREET